MNCDDCLFLFDDYIDDELEARVSSEISEHLAVCRSCAFSYEEFRRQQEAVEHYLLQAEAIPALWKNLRSAIRNEKVVPMPSSATTISGKFKEVFENFGVIFSPRGMALSGFAVIAVCAILFFLVRQTDNPAEYAENNRVISPVSQSTEPARNHSSASENTEKGSSPASEKKSISTPSAKRFEATRIERLTQRISLLPRKKTERKKSKTISPPDESSVDLLPGEQEYLEIIAGLTEEVKSIEPMMPKVLSIEYKRNLSAVDKAIEETRKSARRHPKNQDVMSFVTAAYQGKIALLSEAVKR